MMPLDESTSNSEQLHIASSIVCVDVVADGLVELDDGAEDAAFEAPFGQGGEQALDGIDP